MRQLTTGDTALMCSDGVTAAHNPRGQQWGTSGLLDALARHQDVSRSELLHAIDTENSAFADGEPSGDDRTAVVATYRGK